MQAGWKAFGLSLAVAAILVVLLVWNPERPTVPGPSGVPLLVYCAAGIKPPMEAIAREYGDRYKVEVQLQYGGSGTLLANLQVARSGDLYIAAEQSYTDIAVEKGLVDEIVPLAFQRPVIVVRKGNPKGIRGLPDLLREDVRVALGSPDAAAIGKETKEILEKAGRWAAQEEHVTTRGVFVPTVGEVANNLKIGAVDAGVVWDVMVKQYPELEAVEAPELAVARQQITIAVLKSCKQPARALHFARYLSAPEKGLRRFGELGYEVVDGDVWEERPEILLFSGGVNRIAIQDTLKAFEEREGVTVITSYKGCGLLVGELRTGKRPDAYFACDSSYMTQVSDLFLDQINVSETDMVLLTQRGNPKAPRTLGDLTRPGLKVAVANPQYSALGGLTVRLLKEAGIYEDVQKNITYGDSPTADFLTVRVKTGMEDVALVYRANTVSVAGELDVSPIDHPAAKAVQPIAVGKESRRKHLMGRLVKALLSSQSRDKFEASGFRWVAGQERTSSARP